MKHPGAWLPLFVLLTIALGQEHTSDIVANRSLLQATLTAPGSPPFHLKATITAKGDQNGNGKVELFWVAPDKWRRTIQTPEFSQTLVVNGDKVFEEDSDDYFPLELQTLVTAMVDPEPLLNSLRPGDRFETQANGRWTPPRFCANQDPQNSSMWLICGTGPFKQKETVDAPGHPVIFADYQKFKGKNVARFLITGQGVGVALRAQPVDLTDLKKPDEGLFSIQQPTPKERQIHTVVLPEAEFRGLALQVPEIIWPQVLDGDTVGVSSYYLSVDRSGQVREIVALKAANERANESAFRQIMRWKFKPAMRDGVAVQAESILTFATNTRAWGPPEPLTDAEVRKLVLDIVEPVFPASAASGTTYTLRAAIDSDGQLIEVIAGDGPPELFQSCYEAIKKWHFSPVMENGQPRPYRAAIAFQVP